jgi:uncharacterized protein (DUF58 family)
MTRSGKLVLVAGIIGLVAGRIFGLDEVVLLAIAALLLLLVAGAWVRLRHPGVHIERRVTPSRVNAGEASHVELSVRAAGTRTSPPITLTDPVTGTAGAIVALAPVPPGEPVDATYALPTEHRGVVWVGPLQLELSDPFGLAVRRHEAAPARRLTVLPRVDLIAPVRSGRGDDPLGEVSRGDALSPAGDEFAALRPYVVGDELRRVHWRTSARLDTLMTRREERPWQGRCTVLLDVRSAAHNAASLERAVSAAASVAAASIRGDESVRLLTTGGFDSGHGAGRTHLDQLLEELAVVGTSETAALTPALAALRGAAAGGSLVVLTTSDADLSSLHVVQRSFRNVVTVAFDRPAVDDTGTRPGRWMPRVDRADRVDEPLEGGAAPWAGAGHLTIPVAPATPFPQAWQRAMGPPSVVGTRRGRAAQHRPAWSAR